MSFLKNLSFTGDLETDKAFVSPIANIPDGYETLLISIRHQESGNFELFCSNDNNTYAMTDAIAVDGATSYTSIELKLQGLYFYIRYVVDATDYVELVSKISTNVLIANENPIISGNLDMNGYDIVDCGTLYCSNIVPPPAGSWQGTATSDLNMANYDITNVDDATIYGTLNVNTINAPSGELDVTTPLKSGTIKTDAIEGKTGSTIGVNAEFAMNNFKITEADEITAVKYSNQLGTRSLTLDETSTLTSNLKLGESGEYNLECYKVFASDGIELTNLYLKPNAFINEIQVQNDLALLSNDIIGVDNLDCTTINGLTPQQLTAGTGIDIASGQIISTVGNPNIQLTYRSYYVNEEQSDLQTALTASAGLQGVNIYMSSGSFGGSDIYITGQTNQNIIAPMNQLTLCEIGTSGSPRNLFIQNCTRICVNNLQINGAVGLEGGGGSHKFLRCNITKNVTLTGLSGSFVVFENCEFGSGFTITLNSLFAGVVYFINCNFNNVSFDCQQSLATQCIINNCSGLASLTSPTKRTLVGLCTTTAGVVNVNTQNINLATINGAAYPPAGSWVGTATSDLNMANYSISNVTNINGAAYPPTTFDPENQEPVKYGSGSVGNGAGARSVSIGEGSGSNPTFPNGTDCIAIGTGSNARATDTIAIGKFALVTGSDGIAIGREAYSSGLSVAIGIEAMSNTNSSTAGVYIGNQVCKGAGGLCQDSTIIGEKAGYNTQSIQESVVIGGNTWNTTNCMNVVAVGRNSGQNSTGSNLISIGNNSSLNIDSKNVVIGNGCFNGTGGLTRGCVIIGNDISNFTGVSNNTLIINNSQSAFEPTAVENAVYIKNVRNTGIDNISYAGGYNSITYNDQTNEVSKQRMFISRGQFDGGNPATVVFGDSMFDDITKIVVLFNKQGQINHPNSSISFSVGGGQLTFTSSNANDNDYIGVQAYRITL